MKYELKIEVEHKDDFTTVLTNEHGDTFTYNPQDVDGEELDCFLTNYKILPPEIK